MKAIYNIKQNKFNVKFQTGYYPLPGGGGGGGDTSNLVPYTGANKDVNIASNYFKTSKGFDFTKDSYNYFKVLNYGNYNSLDFYSKDNSTNNFGEVVFRIDPEEGLKFYEQNNIGYSSFQVYIDGTFSIKKFITEEGYKIVNGTPNQALTANGGVFDLNTKADLVSGKIPASQLPAYVDDVLEYANLASFPATGESGKIYIAIDTNLTYRWGGSSYVVMSSSLALGETASTAYRGDRGKIAYDHSQNTGNPHGTKLEELTDLGSETPSIEDTDIILKKEVGGFWKKITFANFKSWFANENKKATITVELISQLTTNFYAPNALRINSTALISGSGTLTLKVNDVAYTLGNLIPQGAKITAETTSQSVYNLMSIYE